MGMMRASPSPNPRTAVAPKVEKVAEPVKTTPNPVQSVNKPAEEPTVKVTHPPAATVEYPEWIVKKAQQICEIMGSDVEKTRAYVAVNKFATLDDLVERLMNGEKM